MSEKDQAGIAQEKPPYVLILFLSALTLQLEFLQTRILSFALWHHFVYIVITMALMGFAASGTFLSLSTRLAGMSRGRFFAFCLSGFSLTSFPSLLFATLPVSRFSALRPDAGTVLVMVLSYTVCMAPYFFAGLGIGGAFVRFPRRTARLYAANLAGSGLGCLSFVLLVGPLGAPRLLALSSLVALVPLPGLSRPAAMAGRILTLWALFLAAALFAGGNSFFHMIVPEPNKLYSNLYHERTRYEFTKWNSISRVDVICDKDHPETTKFVLADGDAASYLFPFSGFRKEDAAPDRRAAFVLLGRPAEKALVLGVGGGMDVLTAYFEGARRIDGVEINPATCDLVTDTYSSFLGDIFRKENVRLFQEDGRAFARGSGERYDVITLYATDTLLAIRNGAYMLLDSYLYTKDAFKDYIRRLSDGGCIQVVRYLHAENPAETLRVFTTMLEALRDLGYKDPSAHVFVFGSSNRRGSVIVKKTPFTEEEEIRLQRFLVFSGNAGDQKFSIRYSPGWLRKHPGMEASNEFLDFAGSFAAGREGEFHAAFPYNVIPASDDRPFSREKRAIFVLSSLLLQAGVLSAAFVLLPLVFRRASLGGFRSGAFSLVYFSSIGLAFMFMEMSVIQKLSLFLGAPVYSMAAVIPAILVFAGLGSLASRRLDGANANLPGLAALAACLLVLLLSKGITPVTARFLGEPGWIKVLIAVGVLAPASFCMGMPFSLGLRAVPGKAIPWAWAINGSASVMASILAVLLAFTWGFSLVLSASVLLYATAGLGAFAFLRRAT